MNALTIAETANLTMSSREIAELTEKRHADVMRDIRNMLGQLELQADGYTQNCADPQNGQMYPVFKLPKDLTLTLVAGYNVKLRKRIIDRWLELEAKVGAGGTAIPQTLPEALRLAADLAEQKAKAEAQLAIAAPKAEALDRIATPTEGAVCLRVAAKLLQMPEKQFLQFANAKGFIFRNHRSRIWQGYSDKAKAGLVELKLTTVERDDGSSKTVEQALITHAGIAKLAQMLGRGGNC